MKFDVDEVNRLIKARRSVFSKSYLPGRRVDDKVVQQILENANWAPTHKLTEPWRFVVFTGNGLQRLAEFQAECYKQVAERDGTFKEDRYQNLKTKPLHSSHIIAVGMKRDQQKRIKEVEEIGAVFCAIQNMHLTATAYGVGCYLSTGGVTYFEETKSFFGLEPEDRLIGFLHLGVVDELPREGKRQPIKEKINWIE